MNVPELLLPAGSLQHMRYAYAYGVDAVYAGQQR
jgi:putative protease